MSISSANANCTIENQEETRDTRAAVCHAHMRQIDEVIRRTPPWLGPSEFVSLERRGPHRYRNLAIRLFALFLNSRRFINETMGETSTLLATAISDSRWLACSRVSPVSPEVVSDGQRWDHNSELAIRHLLSSLPLLPPQILDAFSEFLHGKRDGRGRRICVPGGESKSGFNLVLEHYKDPNFRILTWTQPQRSLLSLCDRNSDTWLPRPQGVLQSFPCLPNPLIRVYHMDSDFLVERSSRLRSANTSPKETCLRLGRTRLGRRRRIRASQ
ncbi:hypothetical protein CPB86DRAFT_608139 [Serendipita vermifera]|nr:hypothetical protein CPB86DRAFT_608139 [Serendipita vermifera]